MINEYDRLIWLTSVRASLTFFRYSIVALLSFVIDFCIFALIFRLSGVVFLSLMLARGISSFFNFYQNKFVVYRAMEKARIREEAKWYFILALSVFVSSYVLINALHQHYQMDVLVARLSVDGLLFVGNFVLQGFLFRRTLAKQWMKIAILIVATSIQSIWRFCRLRVPI